MLLMLVPFIARYAAFPVLALQRPHMCMEVPMTAVTAPQAGRSLIGKVISDLQARARRRGKPSRVAALLRDHLLTMCGLAAGDVGLFHLGAVPGCVALMASIFVLDYKLQG